MNSLALSQSIEGYNMVAQDRRLSIHTIADYNNTYRKLLTYLGDVPVSEITPGQLRSFLGAQQVSQKTILNYHVGLSALFSWLVSDGLLQVSPMLQVQRPRPKTKQIVPFTEADIRSLFSVANHTQNPDRTRSLLYVLLDTGLRASELCDARIQDLDLKNHRLKVTGKGAKERILPFSNRTAQSLWRILLPRSTDPIDSPLFITQQNRPFTRDRLLKFVNSLGSRANVQDCYPHRFRHTFAIMYLRNGGDPFTLQQILGHSDVTTVRIYLALAQSDLDERHRLASPVDRWKL